MMGQLLSKDVLYEPMKEMFDRVRAGCPCLVTFVRSPSDQWG